MKYQNWIYNLFGCCKGYERKAFKLTSILENKFYTKKTMAKNIALGLILVGIAIIFLISISIFKLQINSLTNALMVESGGTCIIEGKCLHEKSNTPVYIGVAITFVTLSLGLYLIFFAGPECMGADPSCSLLSGRSLQHGAASKNETRRT